MLFTNTRFNNGFYDITMKFANKQKHYILNETLERMCISLSCFPTHFLLKLAVILGWGLPARFEHLTGMIARAPLEVNCACYLTCHFVRTDHQQLQILEQINCNVNKTSVHIFDIFGCELKRSRVLTSRMNMLVWLWSIWVTTFLIWVV